jgi:predicted RNA binding protein YcfA (HicA-like mRNA interferase family)
MDMRISKDMRSFVMILHKNDYELSRTKGSHYIYENIYTHKSLCVNKDLNDMVRLRLIKEYNLQV